MKNMQHRPLGHSHVRRIVNVGYYRAPSVACELGYQIPPEREYIEFLTAGNVYFHLNQEERLFGTGSLFWHLPGESTIRLNVPSNPYECLVVSFEVDPKPVRQVPRVSVIQHKDEAERISTELLRTFHQGGYNAELFTQYAYLRLLWQAHSARHDSPTRDMPRFLKKVTDYIGKNYEKDLLVDDLARIANVSAPYLYNVFKKHLSTSPHQYLLNVRLNQSKHYLVTTDLQIKAISDRCGFMNVESYCRAFKKQFRSSPGKYREKTAPFDMQSS